MATRRPLTRVLGRTRQLPAGDPVNGVYPPYIPLFTANGRAVPVYRRDGIDQGVSAYVPVFKAAGTELRVDTDANFAITLTRYAGDTRLANAGVAGTTQKSPYQFANLAGFPAIGSPERLYVAADTRFEYVWSGNGYVLSSTVVVPTISSTDDLPEGQNNLYFTVGRVLAALTNTDALAEGVTNLYFTAARVRAVVLTGLAAGTNVAIAAADTLLVALAKLQTQIDNKLSTNGDGSQLTSLNATQLTSGTVPSARLSGTYGISISGNAATATSATSATTATSATSATTATTATQATKLQTARTINGVAFDGTANITLSTSGSAFTGSFVSGDIALTLSTYASVSHGLGATPKLFFGRIKCVTAEKGYSVGDVVSFDDYYVDQDGGGTTLSRRKGYTVGVSSTTIFADIGNTDISINDKNGGTAYGAITVANWRLVLYAFN